MELGVAALPRGGTLRADLTGEGAAAAFTLTATGKAAKLNEQVTALLSGEVLPAIAPRQAKNSIRTACQTMP